MDKREITDWISKQYLLIDDFPSMCQMLRDMLHSLGARYIDQAENGATAASMLRRKKYDVVLCDYHLGGGKNGQQVLEEAKIRDLVGPACIWLMVSGVKNVESVMGAAEYQPDGYLLKPLTEAFLLTRLNRAWARKQVFQEIDRAYDAKDYLKAVELCHERLETDRLHALDLMRMKANLLMKSGEPEHARAVFEQVMVEREFVWAKTGIAKIHVQSGEYESARQLLQEVIEENVFYLDAYDQLAFTELQLGHFAEAEQVLASAAKLSPNSVLRQKNLGAIALKMGHFDVAEKAFRKSVEIGEHSVLKTPDAYFGLARVWGGKNQAKEALQLLATVRKEFDTEEIRLRAKVTEGLVYHESGDWVKARKSGDELAELLDNTTERPDADTCLDMARLLFAVGVKDAPVELLREVVKNNHDNVPLALEVQQIFDKARMSEQGADIVNTARREASEMMDRGVILWKAGKLAEAVQWMRHARSVLPSNVRVLFNYAHLLIAYMEQNGADATMATEARKTLLHADKLAPNQRRFAQLQKQLGALLPNGDD
ncbi:tetratricopeptide repeat protein [Noviherbaspirillum sp.]|uniref:tetratricopeptide repeat protein n=1 Tax=Noviherbaspirillum sp. TaxID=1926288 RepID=UPI002B4A7CA3|nr:tetratricopeptide repeat protein [Noviherbaspirillum sp.]HJV83242.1 tetratricopeptide repeat protein [Noviherbaspirillum sp.]